MRELKTYMLTYTIRGQGIRVMGRGDLVVESPTKPAGFTAREMVACWASVNVPGVSWFDATGEFVSVSAIKQIGTRNPDLTYNDFIGLLGVTCSFNQALHAKAANLIDDWIKPPCCWDNGNNPGLQLSKKHRLYISEITESGTKFVSSAGPNSVNSFSGYMPGANTLDDAKARCYDYYLRSTRHEHHVKRKRFLTEEAWKFKPSLNWSREDAGLYGQNEKESLFIVTPCKVHGKRGFRALFKPRDYINFTHSLRVGPRGQKRYRALYRELVFAQRDAELHLLTFGARPIETCKLTGSIENLTTKGSH